MRRPAVASQFTTDNAVESEVTELTEVLRSFGLGSSGLPSGVHCVHQPSAQLLCPKLIAPWNIDPLN